MSDSQVAWGVLWAHAESHPGPFEIEDIVPELAEKLGTSEAEARRVVSFLLTETGRLPDGRQYFCVEGAAVVPLPEYAEARDAGAPPLQTYPFEL